MVVHRGRRLIALLSVLVLLVATLYIPNPARAGDLGPGGTFVDDDGNTHEGDDRGDRRRGHHAGL